MSAPVIELRQVSKVYRLRNAVTALEGVDLVVAPGEHLAVVGPSGSGKSTLLTIAGTLERPSSGAVLWDGRPLGLMSDRELSRLRSRHIGFVFQTFHLLSRLTALENVMAALMYGGVPRSERNSRGRELLRRVGLQDRASHYQHQLSGGEQQRVAIARAIANRPTLLVADEPTGDLDPKTGGAIVETMLNLSSGTSIVVATHNPNVAAAMDRQISLDQGRLRDDDDEPS